MSTRQSSSNIKNWLRLEEEGLLAKQSISYDSKLRAIKIYKTRIDSKIGDPSLCRKYTYSANGKPIGGTPLLSVWTITEENNQSGHDDIAMLNVLVNDASGKSALNVISSGGTTSVSGLRNGGVITHVALDALTWEPMPLSLFNLRNNLTVQNISGNGNTVLWNYLNTAPITEGYRITDGGHKSVSLTSTIQVYCRMLSGTGLVVIDEVG